MSADTLTIQISATAMYSGIAVMGSIVGWLVRLESRLNARLTRREHTDICDKRHEELSRKIEHMLNILEKQNEASVLHRQLVGDSLAEIRTKVAVLRDRLGDDPLQESGLHRRR